MKLFASSFVLGELAHPNRMPFSGVLCYLNAASDQAPNGSNGLPVYISADVGIPALPSLVGMAVNYVPDSMGGHNKSLKIGVIEAASAGDPDANGAIPVNISGYVFAEDFADAAIAIKLNQASLGFSYETTLTKISAAIIDGTKVANVDELGFFTGASILFKSTAAYQNTSLAASADPVNGGEILDNEQIIAAINALRDYIDAKFLLLSERQYADAVSENAQEYVDVAVDAVIEATETLDELVGDTDETLETEAVVIFAEAEVAAVETETEEVAAETVVDEPAVQTELLASTESPEITELRVQLQAANAQLAEQAALNATQRKSFSPLTTTLMAKFDVDSTTDYTSILASIDARTDLSIEDRFALKMEARKKEQQKSV